MVRVIGMAAALCLGACGAGDGAATRDRAEPSAKRVPDPFLGRWAVVGRSCLTPSAGRMTIAPGRVAFDDRAVSVGRIAIPSPDAVRLTLHAPPGPSTILLTISGAGSLMDVTASGGRATGYRRCLSKAKTGS